MKIPTHIGLATFAWLMLAVENTAALAGEVSCEGFALGYDGGTTRKTCSVTDDSTGNNVLETKEIVVEGVADYLMVSFGKAGFRTYIPSISVGDMVARISPITDQQP